MKCKVAVIGTGSIGMKHLTLLKQMKGVEPIAIPKRKERLSELESQDFRVALSLSEAAEQGTTLAVIASNTAQHREDALQAIACGMDLLVEKPLAVDTMEALSIYEAAQKNKKKLFVACVLRFSETLQTFREWLSKIDKVYAVRIECQSFLPDWRPNSSYQESYSARASEGGVLRDLIHEIDYATWIFGQPKTVQAELKNKGLLKIEAEEFAQLWWETREGISVSICLDYLSRIPRRRMMAFGKEGNLEWDGIAGKTRLQLPNKQQEFPSNQSKEEMYFAQLESFLKVGHDSKTITPLASGWEGIQALKICDTARSYN